MATLLDMGAVRRFLSGVGVALTVVALAAACGPRASSSIAPESTWTPPAITVPDTGERVTDVFAASLTPAQQEEIEAACFDAQGVPIFGESGCETAMDELEWKRTCDTAKCVLLGRIEMSSAAPAPSAAPRAAYLQIVVRNPQPTTSCPPSERLCRGVVIEKSTHDAARLEVQAGAVSSPSATETSEASEAPESSETPTDSPTPTSSSSETAGTPVPTPWPTYSEESSPEPPEPDDSEVANESDPPADEQ